VEHEIHFFPNSPLPNIGLYRQSILEANEVKKQLQQLLEQGVILPSNSPCGSPIIIVPKKDGTWRMCINYRALNKIVLKNRYPLPRIDDLLHQLQHEKYFTKMDLKSEYHQLRIKEEDTWNTAFKTRQGLYEWLVMLFGLCNAPTTFMRLMNDVLRPYLDSFVIVYLDDILVYSATWEENMSHLMQVLETLKNHQLLANLNKCKFAQQCFVYLGYVISGGELEIDLAKMEAIMKWLIPTNFTEVRSFVGATQYLQKFIASFLAIVAPLHAITTSGKSFLWGKNQQKAFDDLKRNISQAPMLMLPNL
jgi:hypothetical protein